jgi:formylglycine-generating enzyme required for sulfatase activity
MNLSRWRAVAVLAWALAACGHPRGAGERAGADLAAGAMVSLPGGRFWLANRTGPLGDTPTNVSVRPFLLDVTEVTVAAYGECVRAGRCTAAAASVRWDTLRGGDRASWARFCNQDRADRADHPVNCVDWGQARSYCAWAGKRLPTEDEWEWAARNGGDATPFPWGAAPPGDRPCWSGPPSDADPREREGTCAAGSHPEDVSAAGVKDLGGGVSEWTRTDQVVGADSRGRDGSTARVFRGGAWADREPFQVSSAARSAGLPERRDPRLGFRCASDP